MKIEFTRIGSNIYKVVCFSFLLGKFVSVVLLESSFKKEFKKRKVLWFQMRDIVKMKSELKKVFYSFSALKLNTRVG